MTQEELENLLSDKDGLMGLAWENCDKSVYFTLNYPDWEKGFIKGYKTAITKCKLETKMVLNIVENYLERNSIPAQVGGEQQGFFVNGTIDDLIKECTTECNEVTI